jgi:tetratricopeptide (TPR) repeat protein
LRQTGLLTGLRVRLGTLLGRLQTVGTRSEPAHHAHEALPPTVREFTGRRDALLELRKFVPSRDAPLPSGPVVVTLYGQPGTGKSALAAHFVDEMRDRFPDQPLYLDLKGTSAIPLEPREALNRLVRSLGGGPDLIADEEGLIRKYRSGLERKQTIVFLDNAASVSQVLPLLPRSQSCFVLITSRHSLDGLADSKRHRLGVMTEKESLALLARIAGAHVRSRENERATKQLASLCGYLPLALSIAGVYLRSRPEWPVSELVSRFDERRLRDLDAGNVDVRVSFDLIYEYLTDRERTLFRRLRLLPEHRFGPSMAAALLDCTRDEAVTVLDLLVRKQVLELVDDQPQRYGFHDLIGSFANERLEREERSEERHEAHERALRVYLREAMRHAALLDATVMELDGATAGSAPAATPVSLSDQVAALDWFERERSKLLMASRQSAQIKAHDVTWKLAASLVPFFDLRGHRADWAEIQEAALKAAHDSGELRAQAWSRLGAGHLYGLDGLRDEAMSHLTEALESARAGGWPRLQARALYLMGRVEHEARQLSAALAHYERAASIFHEERLVHEQATTILYVAAALYELERIGTDDLFAMAWSVLVSLGGLHEEVWVVRTTGRIKEYLGRVAAARGDLIRADSYSSGSREAYRKIGFTHGYGRALRDLGQIRLHQQDWRLAREFLGESSAMFRTIGDRYSEGLALLLAGEALGELGNNAEARICMQDAVVALSKTERSDLPFPAQRSA